MKLWRRNGIWQYRFQVAGVRHQESTGTNIKGQAEAIAVKAWTEAKERAAGVFVPTLKEHRENWLKAQAGAVGLGHWNNVNTWDPHGLETLKIDRLNTEVVQLAREKHRAGVGRISATRADATVDAWMRILNLLMNWAIDCKILRELPYTIKMPRPQKRPKRILALAQVQAFLAAVDKASRNPQVGTAARLMIGLGLRASEAVGSRWEWIDWETRTYTPGRLEEGHFTTKGGEAEPLDLPDWLHDHLLALRGDNPRLGLILPWKVVNDVEMPHPTGFCRASMRSACKALGITGVTAHRARGTWITHLLRQGTPLKEVQAMARHKEQETTLGYYEDSSEVRKEAMKKLAKGMGLA